MKQVREHRDDLVARLPALQVAFVALLLLVVAAYWNVQVVQGDHFRRLAENNRMRTVPLEAPRGLIFDRGGRLLVENVPSYNLLFDRSRSRDRRADLAWAAGVLERTVEELEGALAHHLGTSPYNPVLIAENLSLSQVARFAASTLEHPEFEIDVSHLRLYRHGPLTAHALGHLGEVTTADLNRLESPYHAGDLVGKRGVEQTFDLLLRGRDGERVVIVDSHGRVRQEAERHPASPGKNLEVALDLELQQEAARYFTDRAGAVVALDPQTGEVLVLASAPSYNPNLFARRLDQSSWRDLLQAPHDPLQNRAIQSTYAPGSIFKIVVAVAGLAERVVGLQDAVYCPGATVIYNRRFRCWKRSGHGWVKLRDAIKESCDVYFYHLGQKLGISRIAHYAHLFGLGERTGFDIAGEKAGLVPDPEWSLARRRSPWYPGETISVAIGQGPLLLTPLQVASMMATVANGGYRVAPHLASSARPPTREPIGVDGEILGIVADALWAVVNEQGTGASARVAGIDVAGKTGTVQVVQQKTWVESDDLPYEKRDHAWFASFAQKGDTRLAVVVFVEHGGRGSRAAAPLAKALFEIYFRDHLGARQPS